MVLVAEKATSQDTWKKNAYLQLKNATNDSAKVDALAELCNYYKFKNPDSALFFGFKAISLAEKIGYPVGQVEAMGHLVLSHISMGNEIKATRICLQGLKIALKNHLKSEEAMLLILQGILQTDAGNYPEALASYRRSTLIFEKFGHDSLIALPESFIGEVYANMNQKDSALYFGWKAFNDPRKASWISFLLHENLGHVLTKTGHFNLALIHYKNAIDNIKLGDYNIDYDYISNVNLSIAKVFQLRGLIDSSIYYARRLWKSGKLAVFIGISLKPVCFCRTYMRKPTSKNLMSIAN